ncbi:MAG: hypothetical protein MUE55_00065 [Thermoplasmata archaeon]|nr:hypothetical protein [Thermoplasmata archaeon]
MGTVLEHRPSLYIVMRHHIRGPTKKLAPTVDSETSCPHSFNDEDGFELEVDCHECPGASDLHNRRCASGMVHILATGARPESIVLKRYIHKRFRGAQVELLCAAAEELCALTRAMSAAEPPSDKECRTCVARATRVIAAMRGRLLEDPGSYFERAAELSDQFRSKAMATTCARARTCIDETLSVTTVRPLKDGGHGV